MAKAGVIGLTLAMAAEGTEVDIAANVVAPYAKTRQGTGFGPLPWSEDLASWLHPSKVAPVVAWLAHESCEVTGECFAVGAGHVARVAFAVNDGFTDHDLTPETVAAHAQDLAAPAEMPAAGPSSPLMTNMMNGF
jgi:NAD(P)-dependent dehydrogenase (short-subunit alcohol dehydrogenase family)